MADRKMANRKIRGVIFLSAIFPSAIFLSAIFLSAGRNGDLGRGGEGVHLRFAGGFAVNKLAQPHLEIDQRPEPLGMIARARLMFGYQVANKRRIEDAALETSRAERVIVERRSVSPAEPCADRGGKTHLAPCQDWFGQQAF